MLALESDHVVGTLFQLLFLVRGTIVLRLRLLNEDRWLGYLWSLDIGASVQYKPLLLNVRADLRAVCTDQKQVPAEVDRLEGDVCRDSLENGQEKLWLQSIIA